MYYPGIRICSLHIQLLAVLFWFTVGCADRDSFFPDTPDSGANVADYSEEAVGSNSFRTGAMVLLDKHLAELKDKRVGLIANPSSRVAQTHLLDTLISRDVQITALFAPEHGFRGDLPAGEEVQDDIDLQTGLPVFSLYGSTRKPIPSMLKDVDILIFDLQDAGARFYTYISTLGLAMEAAAENDVEIWVLDRPNPLGGEYISGWLMEDEFRSFVGAFPIPVSHGMTIGELATMMLGLGWINPENTMPPNLRVIKMENWMRNHAWTDIEPLPDWRPPSPNLPHFTNTLVYPGMCFLEGTNMSEGRGTRDPFLIIGSPSLSLPDSVLQRLESEFPVSLEKIFFTPESIPGMATSPKHEGVVNKGVRISPLTLNPTELQPVEMGLSLIREMIRYDSEAKTNRFMYNLAGTRQIDFLLESYQPAKSFWEDDVEVFRKLREPYLLYE
ncbi:MAG: DUF1343 domain-containing protein [Balneolales bacterium]|nr:DUF1343 domain-containing protein [Balneolales bacterium]